MKTTINKCSHCNRRLGKTIESRYRHYVRNHPERVGQAILGVLPVLVRAFPVLRAIGAGIGVRKAS